MGVGKGRKGGRENFGLVVKTKTNKQRGQIDYGTRVVKVKNTNG